MSRPMKRSVLSERLISPEDGASGSQPSSEHPTATALNIPATRGGENWAGASPSRLIAGSSGEGQHGGSLSLSYGTSPGHGMGYLMRSRRYNKAQLPQESSFHSLLQSHDESSERIAALDLDMESGPAAPLLPDDREQKDALNAPVTDGKFSSPSMDYEGEESMNEYWNLPSHRTIKRNLARSEESPPTHKNQNQIMKAAVFGGINAVAGIPALVAYAAIVFRHPAYAAYIDPLSKMFFLSSAIHQAVFCLLSSLPFAMGQVQDVGIIFLSAMGTSIAALTIDAGGNPETALGTALLTMTVSTFLVGCGTLIVGSMVKFYSAAKKSWAQFVQYIPLPVMGGYLGYVGYFCIVSGISLACGVDIDSLASWINLFQPIPLLKCLPTVLSCAFIILTLEKVHHPLALPSLLVGLVVIFHVVLRVAGFSLDEAQASGWVLPPAKDTVQFWKLWRLFHFQDAKLSGIYFPAIWRQAAKAIGLLLVVVFGSCMDIAAIQQDLPHKVDFNRELTTVAVSNMVTGIAGCGFTGSYIFSQSIITLRAGVHSRVNGWVISASEAVVFALPFSIVQYLPTFFLGSLMLWFGVEISRDWLVLAAFRLSHTEYVLLWLTFGSILQWGLEGGIAAGIVCATLYFAYAYAQSQLESLTSAQDLRSKVVRTIDHEATLQMMWKTHATASRLQGFVFFGSAQSIGTKLQEEAKAVAGAGMDEEDKERERLQSAVIASLQEMGDSVTTVKLENIVQVMLDAPRFFIVDFTRVSGMDSTGARMVGSTLRELATMHVNMVLANVDHHGISDLLQSHEVKLRHLRWPPEVQAPVQNSELEDAVIGFPTTSQPEEPEALCFTSLEEGLRFCEDALLEVAVRHKLCTAPGAVITLQDLLAAHLEKMPLIIETTQCQSMAKELLRFMTLSTVSRGDVLWRWGDVAQDLFIIQRGVIRVDQLSQKPTNGREELSSHSNRLKVRSFELGPGCVAGSADFYLNRPHRTQAVCASRGCQYLRLSRNSLKRMSREAPLALNVLQMVVMRANVYDLSAAADVASCVTE